jgi:hypothetical protein
MPAATFVIGLIVSLLCCMGEPYAQGISRAGEKIANLTVKVAGVDEPVYRVGGDVKIPQLIFTPAALHSGPADVPGSFVVSMIVTSKGDLANIKVMSPLGDAQEARTIEAARTYRFKPGAKSGQPVSVRILVEIDFEP